jgi:hypothetical protein
MRHCTKNLKKRKITRKKNKKNRSKKRGGMQTSFHLTGITLLQQINYMTRSNPIQNGTKVYGHVAIINGHGIRSGSMFTSQYYYNYLSGCFVASGTNSGGWSRQLVTNTVKTTLNQFNTISLPIDSVYNPSQQQIPDYTLVFNMSGDPNQPDEFWFGENQDLLIGVYISPNVYLGVYPNLNCGNLDINFSIHVPVPLVTSLSSILRITQDACNQQPTPSDGRVINLIEVVHCQGEGPLAEHVHTTFQKNTGQFEENEMGAAISIKNIENFDLTGIGNESNGSGNELTQPYVVPHPSTFSFTGQPKKSRSGRVKSNGRRSRRTATTPY